MRSIFLLFSALYSLEKHRELFNYLSHFIFFMKKRRTAFNKIWAQLSTLAYWELQYPKDLVEFISKFNEYEDHRNESLERWRMNSDQLLIITQNAPVPNDLGVYLKAYDGIVYSWQQSEERTHYHNVQERLVYPLRDLNRENSDFPFVLTLNNHLLSITHYYDSMDKILKVNRDRYWTYYFAYKKAGKSINISNNIISLCGYKTLYFLWQSTRRKIRRILKQAENIFSKK